MSDLIAILEQEIPESCDKCLLCFEGICIPDDRVVANCTDRRGEYCPLRIVPRDKKKEGH